MKQLAVVSGKGGTGKTSTVASFAALAPSSVVADCDVDAADLGLVLEPTVLRDEPFVGGAVATVRTEKCAGCGRCRDVCRFEAVTLEMSDEPRGALVARVDTLACEGCGACALVCPEGAITLAERENGRWFVSETRVGPLVHAELGAAEENSGKLVTLVRGEARRIARERDLSLVLIDGSPGIGCPVIASLTGVDLALVVTEPTLAGLSDLKRIVDVATKLRVPAAVTINKWDLNLESAREIEEWCHSRQLPLVGLIPYDVAFTRAMAAERSVVEYSDGAAARALRDLWVRVDGMLGK